MVATHETRGDTMKIVQDRYGYFIRVNEDGTYDNLSESAFGLNTAPAGPLRDIDPTDALAVRMAKFLAARR
jgi:hypothetical protein